MLHALNDGSLGWLCLRSGTHTTVTARSSTRLRRPATTDLYGGGRRGRVDAACQVSRRRCIARHVSSTVAATTITIITTTSSSMIITTTIIIIGWCGRGGRSGGGGGRVVVCVGGIRSSVKIDVIVSTRPRRARCRGGETDVRRESTVIDGSSGALAISRVIGGGYIVTTATFMVVMRSSGRIGATTTRCCYGSTAAVLGVISGLRKGVTWTHIQCSSLRITDLCSYWHGICKVIII